MVLEQKKEFRIFFHLSEESCCKQVSQRSSFYLPLLIQVALGKHLKSILILSALAALQCLGATLSD